MADHHVTHATDNDYVEHEKTYNLFLTLAKWGTLLTIVIVLFAGSMTGLIPWMLTLLATVLGGVVAMKM